MSTVLKVALSQRVDVWADRGERRDALDQRLCQWLMAAGGVPIPVPNGLNTHLLAAGGEDCSGLQSWLQAVKPDAVLLSGGNDIGEMPERDNTENFLLDYAQEFALPLLGICRGMQMMAVWAGGSLVPVEDHVRTRHRLRGADDSGAWPDEVNSFHNFALAGCPPEFALAAYAENGAIEAIRHESLPWEGWMWHPEREPRFSSKDMLRFRALLDSGRHY